jgi:hypothetical protein
MQVLIDHVSTAPAPPSAHAPHPVAADLDALVLSCLAKEPDHRPSDVLALSSALARCEGAGGWSNEHAASWWRTHLPEFDVSMVAAGEARRRR